MSCLIISKIIHLYYFIKYIYIILFNSARDFHQPLLEGIVRDLEGLLQSFILVVESMSGNHKP